MRSADERRASDRARYRDNPDRKAYILNCARTREANRKAEIDAILLEFKSRGCARCGEGDPRCLIAHHRDPATKSMNIGNARSNRSVPIELIKAELEICECLCANCHLKLHSSELPYLQCKSAKCS